MELNEIQLLRRKLQSILVEWEDEVGETIQDADDDVVFNRSVRDMVDIGVLEFAIGIGDEGINRLEGIDLDEFKDLASDLKNAEISSPVDAASDETDAGSDGEPEDEPGDDPDDDPDDEPENETEDEDEDDDFL